LETIEDGCLSPTECPEGNACQTRVCTDCVCSLEKVGDYCFIDTDCDDGDPCTADTCDACYCKHDFICECKEDLDCDDGLWCNGLETCDLATGECVDGTPPDCSDDLFCTVNETCDEGLDQCVSDPRDCSDELFCTINETCDDVINACMSDPRDCTDGDICTDDSCDEANDECDNVFDVTNDPSCAAPTPTPTPGPCANATITVQVTQCDAGVAGLSVALHSSYGDVYGPKGTNAAGQAAFSVIGGSDRAWYALVNGTTMGPTIKVTQCGGAGTIGVVLACVPTPTVEVLGVERLPTTGEMPLAPVLPSLPMILSSLTLIGSGLLLRRKE